MVKFEFQLESKSGHGPQCSAMAGHGPQLFGHGWPWHAVFSAMAGHGSQFLTVAGHGPQFPAMAHHTYLASHEPDSTPEDDDALLARQSKHTYPVSKNVHYTYMLLTYWLMWQMTAETRTLVQPQHMPATWSGYFTQDRGLAPPTIGIPQARLCSGCYPGRPGLPSRCQS